MTRTGQEKGHLEGWQWRQSKRALEKKERAKARHFKSSGEAETLAEVPDFVVSREKVGREYSIVAEATAGRYKVLEHGQFTEAILDPTLPFDLARNIYVGDHVTLSSHEGQPTVRHLVARKTVLSRLRRDATRWRDIHASNEQVIAANVESAVIVVSAKDPPFHPKFVDRYLVLTQFNGITPVIAYNKSDLVSAEDQALEYYRSMGVKVIPTSVVDGKGLAELKETMRGQQAVFVGHSGVGKSSLINAMVPQSELRTGTVSDKSGKGRHTTSASRLIAWDKDSYIVDTPGIRSLEVWNIEKTDLQLYFKDINELGRDCKYDDCVHDAEPYQDCKVKQGVKQGLLPRQRYDSYLKLLREL